MNILILLQYDINFLEKQNNKLVIRKTSDMIIDVKNKKKKEYEIVILKLFDLMNNDNDWLDSKTNIDKVINNLKVSLKDLELLFELLTKIYDDKLLFKMCKSSKPNKINIIEEFSN